jgi:MoaA/NifB/PqqE/SkfB family radical SAM enzyme
MSSAVRALVVEPPQLPSAWLEDTGKSQKIILEITSDCNLKCVYCGTLDPEHRRTTMSFEKVASLVEEVSARGRPLIYLTGQGETTIVKGWEVLTQGILDRGGRVSMLSHLSKRFTDDEINVFAQLERIETSVDVIDPDVFKKTRRGGDLRLIVLNIGRIQAVGLNLKIAAFGFFNMAVTRTNTSVRPFVDIEDDDLLSAHDAFRRAEALVKQAGKTFFVEPELRTTFEAVVRGIHAKRSGAIPNSPAFERNAATGAYSVGVGPAQGETRRCFDAWDMAFLRANGEVHLCCYADTPVGNCSDLPLKDVLSSPAAKRLRSGLLTGDMIPACATCRRYEAVPAETFQAEFARRYPSARA